MSKDLLAQIKEIREETITSFKKTSNLNALKLAKSLHLGKDSKLTRFLRKIKDLDPKSKISIGQKANELRQELESAYAETENKLQGETVDIAMKNEWIDVTVPSSDLDIGHKHPLSSMLELTEDIFSRMGFEVVYPLDINTEYNNFDAVNIPANHPARDMWDTFWTDQGHVAITHTSSMQNTVMKSRTPPIRVIVPGRCYRNEATDMRHEHTFYQLEGIYVDRGITMANMLATIKAFFGEFFGRPIKIMFTPDFFPFVEPGGMVSIDCSELGEGFKKVSKGTGWLEVLGCGMIHPKVLSEGGIDPDVYSGFAFGIGMERLIMLKYQIDDIRTFESGDLRFVKQFKL